MSSKSARRINHRSSGRFFIPFTITLLGIIFLSVIIAFAWQQFQDKHSLGDDLLKPSLPEISSISSSAVTSSSSQSSSSKPTEKPEPPKDAAKDNLYGVPLPESTRVRSEFFDDAVFIGDSITTGIELYGILPNTTVLASTGINLDNIITKEAIKKGDTKVTTLQALAQTDPTSIYIMLGANGLANLTSEQTVDLYRTFAVKVHETKPNANIYIQSILPINEAKFAVKYSPNLNNKKIDECNKLLMEMAGEQKMFYVDVNSAIRDETGGLPTEFTTDGLHFKSEYYNKWIDYLKTHTVPQKDKSAD